MKSYSEWKEKEVIAEAKTAEVDQIKAALVNNIKGLIQQAKSSVAQQLKSEPAQVPQQPPPVRKPEFPTINKPEPKKQPFSQRLGNALRGIFAPEHIQEQSQLDSVFNNLEIAIQKSIDDIFPSIVNYVGKTQNRELHDKLDALQDKVNQTYDIASSPNNPLTYQEQNAMEEVLDNIGGFAKDLLEGSQIKIKIRGKNKKDVDVDPYTDAWKNEISTVASTVDKHFTLLFFDKEGNQIGKSNLFNLGSKQGFFKLADEMRDKLKITDIPFIPTKQRKARARKVRDAQGQNLDIQGRLNPEQEKKRK